MPLEKPDLTPLQKAYLVIKDLQNRMENLSPPSVVNEPIAVIGISCNLPGNINSADGLWEALLKGSDLISKYGFSNRWNIISDNNSFKSAMPHAGLLEDIAGFDHVFFHISPVEAQYMDPQQRHMLMVAYKAFEDAGIASHTLKGSSTGIFVGIGAVDYTMHILQHTQQSAASPYLGSGNSLSGASGRLSYYFGCNGPSMSIDTACSSSLVALHQACQSLRQNECNLALVGGVNLLLSAQLQESLTEAGMLSSDGHCKTFDESANGYVRSEGCLAIVIKKLSDAERDGDRIYACIKGSAIAQDGASGGLTVPNPQAQASVIQQALKVSGIKSSEIDFIEAHGTGTSLGDPVEMEGIKLAFAERNSTEKIRISSIKTNLGHLEAAAGLAGIIKTCLSLYNRKLPQHLHFTNPNKHISWDLIPAVVNKDIYDYSLSSKTLLAGVSSFGFTGTIAHCILQEYHPKNNEIIDIDENYTLTISAPDLEALEALRKVYREYLLTTSNNLKDICYTAALGRNTYKYAFSVKASSIKTMLLALDQAVSLSSPVIKPMSIQKWKKISLPHFPFKLSTHWIGPLPQLMHTSNQYHLEWKQTDSIKMTELTELSSKSIFIYINPSSSALLSTLQKQDELIVIPVYWQNEDVGNQYPQINTKSALIDFLKSVIQENDNHLINIIYDITDLPDRLDELQFNTLFHTAFENGLSFLQSLSSFHSSIGSFILLSQEATQVSKTDKTATQTLQYSLRAWIKSIGLEIPGMFTLSLDISAITSVQELNKLDISAWLQQQKHPNLSVRGDLIFYEILNSIPLQEERLAVKIEKQGVYLITGGSGSLGQHIAQWLIKEGACKIILASRTLVIDAQKNTKIINKQVDVSDEDSVLALNNWLNDEGLVLNGIIHAAGISHSQWFKDQTLKDIERAASTKVRGLRNLSTHLSLNSLDFFVVYSSIASVWGSSMLSHYAAVNAYMDSYVLQLRNKGIPAKSISWGPWADSNMMKQDENSTELLRQGGIIAHRSETVSTHYGQLLHPQYSHEVYVELDKPRFTAVMELNRSSSFWDAIRQAVGEKKSEVHGRSLALNDNLQSLLPEDRAQKIQEILLEQLGEILLINDSKSIGVRKSFNEMGMDSILTVRFVEKLQQQFRQDITTNMIFNYSTIELLSQYINDSFYLIVDSEPTPLVPLSGAITSIESEIKEMDDDELLGLINADIQKYI
ncbi:type I polyketide synthase [Daejeonella sp.]|jgi:acyl transferase domain-containing protein/acyl carrier protein|uniref:type I polyketide synthase n=1 Tax=Daejeonella sp. TaxID=2805397 RepID=UPI003783A1AC